jgi:hypothetical protein
MKKSDITYVVGSVFAAMTCFFYCCIRWFSIKLPRYYPTEHTWKWIKEKGVPSQGWYAMQVFAYLTAGIVAIIVYFILKRNLNNETNLKPATTKILGVVSSLIMVFCMGYIMYYEFHKWGILTPLGQ